MEVSQIEKDGHWILCEIDGEQIGIKCFPRVGSQSILRAFGRLQDMEKWKKCKKRVIVVRNPWERVLSVYYGMFRDKKRDWRMEDRGYPAPCSLTDFVEFLVRTPMEDLDVHTRSMSLQLHGYKAKKKELMTLTNFMEELPYGLEQRIRWRRQKWLHKSDIPEEVDAVPNELFLAWGEKWKEDLALYERAKG